MFETAQILTICADSEGGHTSTFKRLLAKNPGSKGVLRTNLLHGDLEPDMGKVVRPSNKADGAPGRDINAKRGSQTQSLWSRLKTHIPHRYNTRSSVKPIPVTTLSGMNLRPRKRLVPHAKEVLLAESPQKTAAKKKLIKDKLRPRNSPGQ